MAFLANGINRIINDILSRHFNTIRMKILVVAVSGLVLASIVYTLEAVRSEHAIMKQEIDKKVEVVIKLATNLGELPLISRNPEVMKKTLASLKSVADVSYAAFYDFDMNLLEKTGDAPAPVCDHPRSLELSFVDGKDYIDLCAPVFTVKAGEDIDMFREDNARETREQVGWIRIGFSKASLKEAKHSLIFRGLLIAVIFTLISSLLVYKLTAAATKPLTLLSGAVKSVRNGKYPEVSVSSADEVGILTSEFNRMSRAISEREDMLKASLVEKEVLLKEIHHRVKNNMQVISSLLNFQTRYVNDKQFIAILNESQNRIKSMALIHEKLYRSRDLSDIDFNDYVYSLASDLFKFYAVDTDKIALKLDIEDIAFEIDTAIPCGLLINELLTNSLKHAFPEGRGGEINISLRKKQIAGDIEYEMIVGDNGVGIPEDFDIGKTKSLGLQLIMTLTEHQLQGKFHLDRTRGTKFHINFKKLKYKKRI